MTTELKPCPFCGGTKIYQSFMQKYALSCKYPVIACNDCGIIFGATVPTMFMDIDEDYKYKKRLTAEAWNRRTNEQDMSLYMNKPEEDEDARS